MYCNSLIEDMEYCHDENCWMPTLTCMALDRVAQLPSDKFTVRVLYIDTEFERTICCFDKLTEALDFMDGYRGSGDYLFCYHAGETLANKDLWVFEPGVNLEELARPLVRKEEQSDYVDPYDEDIPW